jgi:hypothetical protein
LGRQLFYRNLSERNNILMLMKANTGLLTVGHTDAVWRTAQQITVLAGTKYATDVLACPT